ncbi:MAG: FAD-dependent oxidoreductase [Gammaproteobacteria bacterium]|nr:FAD-dependent oxidoreductase [Gammaproteobacteria bacterium]
MSDIAIIGGGLVGLCAALILQHPGRRVAVIEAADLGRQPPRGLNARSIALAASSVQIFRALGLWQQIEAQAAPIRRIHVSARGRWGVTRLRAEDYALDALGYVIENNALSQILLAAVEAADNIQLEDRAGFESISQGAKVEIGYRKNKRLKKLETALALVADGARSQARSALGIEHHSVDYGQAVVISNVEVSKPQDDTAYERFTAQGPLAMLPLGGKTYACVWTLNLDQAAAVCDLDEAEFGARLQDCFGYRLGLIERVGERFSLALQRTRAEALQQGRCLLIGNAANALHPVAGQSFNLGLRDLACLYELLTDQDLTTLDEESIGVIAREYECLREREQQQVIRYGDGLVTLFSNELPLFDHLRAAGLGLLDLLPALKTQAAFTGMGMTFGGNRLLRGRL